VVDMAEAVTVVVGTAVVVVAVATIAAVDTSSHTLDS
jgi:hypothetical protein